MVPSRGWTDSAGSYCGREETAANSDIGPNFAAKTDDPGRVQVTRRCPWALYAMGRGPSEGSDSFTCRDCKLSSGRSRKFWPRRAHVWDPQPVPAASEARRLLPSNQCFSSWQREHPITMSAAAAGACRFWRHCRLPWHIIVVSSSLQGLGCLTLAHFAEPQKAIATIWQLAMIAAAAIPSRRGVGHQRRRPSPKTESWPPSSSICAQI